MTEGVRIIATGQEIAKAGEKYLNTPYDVMDCQAFVERCMADSGIWKNLPGSNSWYRFIMQNGWVGSPEECKKIFGTIPIGAFLFILEQTGREPEKFKGDGVGNASHIGIYTKAGQGALHSSASRGYVCESKFKGKTINGGWNRIGLWKKISYGDPFDRVLNGGAETVEVNYQARVTGGKLYLREEPSANCDWLCRIPDGTIITITEELGEWGKTTYKRNEGWVMLQFLQRLDGVPDPGQTGGEMVLVPKNELEKIYDQIGDWLGLRG